MMTAIASKPARRRLDQLLVDRGLVGSRSRAQALILGGKVRVGEGDAARRDQKPGDLVDVASPIEIIAPEPYVSRGGHKLAAALDAFAIDPYGLVCLDVGASTGGFTDVLLQRGASRIHAVDVGRGQLAASLQGDPRVVVHDRVNARDLEPSLVAEAVDLAVIDVSFISLALVLGPVASCLRADGRVVALVKPQFEAGRGAAKRGVVRDPAVHQAVLERVVAVASGVGLGARAVVASPLLGPEGNREFLLDLHLGATVAPGLAARLAAVSEVAS
jgi:23S rRNA (cytidine1920-2'-O)/16S rRNA (cytidine1409-2'-O)-methyltransferase